ncbi:MAG: tRNA (adenosine(37)-N6)-threonylcarbamoyltransferase complex ATPase subunit type 1 TsaE [Spirochaetales bacterium]|jgi:tRNA threonylcarbamoyladenosine biosynthesis protein TsaE|nr:tRNA (adenosine(37)-N6)-threonylcarbamoyltransferase complex ATPase subunit type 1 TsaE [Spirochaetales bacterium]
MQTLNRYRTETPDQTIRLGLEIGKQLQPGSVVALHGPLGAGKTTLVKGIARSLNIEEALTSPSFTLIAEYEGSREGNPVTLYHIDLYRISHPQEIEDLGMEEILNGEGICVIEWAEKASEFLPESTVRVEIVIEDKGRRQIKIRGLTPA